MPSSPPNPHREPGRHRPAQWPAREDGNRSIIIFVTVCTKDRKPILANDAAATTLRGVWTEADAWTIGRYVIMPDHIHLFCSPHRTEFSLERWVQFWKSRTAQRWPYPEQQPIWQVGKWDVQLRHDESYSAKWEYVRQNPVRHKLVAHPDEWPWSGEIERLAWHDR